MVHIVHASLCIDVLKYCRFTVCRQLKARIDPAEIGLPAHPEFQNLRRFESCSCFSVGFGVWCGDGCWFDVFSGNQDLILHQGKYDSVSLRFWLEFLGVYMGDFVHIARTAGRSWEDLGVGPSL